MAINPDDFEVVGNDDYEIVPSSPKIEPFDLSKIQLSPYDEYQLAVSKGATPEDYNPNIVPPSLNPDYDAVRFMAQHPIQTASDVIAAPIKVAETGIRKVMDIPDIVGNNLRHTEDFNNPFHHETFSERSEEGEQPIFRFPRSEGTGVVAGGLNTTSDLATSLLGNPEKVVSLALAPGEGMAGRTAAGAFGAQAALSVPGAIKNAYDLTTNPSPDATVAQEVESLAQPVVQAAFARSMLKHAGAEATPPPIQGPPTLGRFLKTPAGAEPVLNVEDFEPLDPQTGTPLSPQELLNRQSRVATPPETPEPEVKTFNLDEPTGGQDASQISKPASVPEPEVRPPVGEGTPLRQQWEAPTTQQANEPVTPTGDARGEPDQEAPQVGAPVKDFITKHQSGERLSNTETDRVGLQVKSVSDLDSLADAWKKSKAEADDALAKSRAEKDPKEKLKILEAFQKKNPPQYLREVIETATNTGSHVEGEGSASVKPLGERPLDWRNNPEVAEWLAKNAKDLGI
ncbi:MAG TPA: hypothetical protein VLK33_10095, partial [Terriglobales bacterium]|nr:hypothetical protein [Terriglobales bacterium]